MEPFVRLIAESETVPFVRSVSVPFLEPLYDQDALEKLEASWRPSLEIGRLWVVEDEGRFVGNAGTYTTDLALPGRPGEDCPTVPMAGLTAVGVHPTHRRRGWLRRLVGAAHDDARERGEPLAGLYASQSSIYGRFGYGWALDGVDLSLRSDQSQFLRPAPDLPIRMLSGAEAAATSEVTDTFEAVRRRQPGQINRRPTYWSYLFADPTEERHGRSAKTWLLCPGGVAGYRVEEVAEGGVRYVCAHVDELIGATADIEAALWRFILDVDLVEEVRVRSRPADEPLRHRLANPRRLRTTSLRDSLWLRILDTPGALTARRYGQAGRLTLEVRATTAVDEHDPALGRFVLDAGPDGASCRRAGSEPVDLTLGLDDLGSLLAGGVRPRTLAAAGRIDEERAGALDAADLLFRGVRDPACCTDF